MQWKMTPNFLCQLTLRLLWPTVANHELIKSFEIRALSKLIIKHVINMFNN